MKHYILYIFVIIIVFSNSLSGSYGINQKVVVTIPFGAGKNITQHFVPNPVVIHTGDTIEWINEDITIHTVNGIEVLVIDDIKSAYSRGLSLNTSLFNSNLLFPGDKFDFSFDQEGIYNYICIIHPYLIWTINVEKNDYL